MGGMDCSGQTGNTSEAASRKVTHSIFAIRRVTAYTHLPILRAALAAHHHARYYLRRCWDHWL